MLPLFFRLKRTGLVPLWILRRNPSAGPYRYPSPVRLASQVNNSATTPRLRYDSILSHLLAGIVGGGIVIGAGYTYYHLSGIKRAVDAVKQVNEYLSQTRESVLKRHPNEAVEYLRRIAKSYAVFVPGSGLVIDRILNSVGEIVDEHQEEASEILIRAQSKIQEIMKHKSELSNVELASRIMKVVGDHLNEIGALGSKAGGKLLDPVWLHLPDMTVPHGKVVGYVGSLKDLSGKAWPRLKKEKERDSEPRKEHSD
ncbi:hypothetical protein E1B28_009965 [Marasmius oreades]|uniref:Uncharacterized protein n=1 Tax=Marasmius oreades TaxID=181124 RepID=A0A9P7RWD0_9AGAR|nr:uncharacterized protein E1B28_009965 [Marasmius oreades]KAG7090885.1 hypothetical protein E1B28_009965 [Marasmius oreades]